MQPEQEIDIPNRPVTRRRPVAARPASAAGAGASAPVDNGPTFGNGASVVGAKSGGKTGWILTTILLLLIAVGGVGFGVWAYMDGNTQKDQLNSQISILQQQNNSLQEQLDNGGGAVSAGEYKNAVIISPNSDTEYFVNYVSSPVDYNTESEKSLNISLTNGEVSICRVVKKNEMVDCNINGLTGKVYKIVELGGGHDASYNNVAFIMEDGTVAYMPLRSSLENNDFTIAGHLDIDGNVLDIFDISAGPADGGESGGSGYITSVIVLNDGTYAIYDESMLN